MLTHWIGILVVLGSCRIASAQAEPAHRRPKIALALSGGAAYSLSELGALEWLEQHRIPVDVMVGTSGGAIVGGWYSTGLELLTDAEIADPEPRNTPADMKLHGISELLEGVNLDGIFRPFPSYRDVDVDAKELHRQFPFGPIAGVRNGRFTFTDGVVPGEDLARLLDQIAGNMPTDSLYHGSANSPFDNLPTPFRTVATEPIGYDVHNWKRIVLGARCSLSRFPDLHISLQDAIRASMAIPYVFTPEYLPPIGGAGSAKSYGLVDGGLRDNYPTDVACDEFNPDVLIGLQINVDLSPLDDFFHATGHSSPSTADVQTVSNSFKYGSNRNHPDSFSIPMRAGSVRPDEFNLWRRLSFAGYQSMEAYVRTTKGAELLKYVLSPADYRRYRAERRDRRVKLATQLASGKDLENAAELTAALGLGSVGIEEGAGKVTFPPQPRAMGPLQFFGDVSGGASTGDRSALDLKLTAKSYGFGSKFSSLEASADAGTFPSAELAFRYAAAPDSWFIRPYLQADSAPISLFDAGRRLETERFGEGKAGVEAGLLIHGSAKISVASEVGDFSGSSNSNFGNRHFLQQVARFRLDTLNSELFPTQGLLINGFVRDLASGPYLESLYQSEITTEFRTALLTNTTLILKAGTGTSFGARPPFELDFGIGGVGSIEGYPTDSLRSPSYAQGMAAFGKRIYKIPFYLGNVQWISGLEWARAASMEKQDVFTGLLFATRGTKLFSAIASGRGYRPRLIVGFGNQPFGSQTLAGLN